MKTRAFPFQNWCRYPNDDTAFCKHPTNMVDNNNNNSSNSNGTSEDNKFPRSLNSTQIWPHQANGTDQEEAKG